MKNKIIVEPDVDSPGKAVETATKQARPKTVSNDGFAVAWENLDLADVFEHVARVARETSEQYRRARAKSLANASSRILIHARAAV